MDAPRPENQVIAPLKQTITKDEHHTFMLATGKFFSSKSKPKIDVMVKNEQKLCETLQVLMATTWKAMTKARPSLTEQTQLLSEREIRNECLCQLSLSFNSTLFLVSPTCYIRALCHWFGWYWAHMYPRNGSGEFFKLIKDLWHQFGCHWCFDSFDSSLHVILFTLG